MMHYHVDLFEVRDGKFYFVMDSEPLMKRAALREFRRKVLELSKQVGKFVVKRNASDFAGAIRVALNHRIAIALSRCDCDGGEGR